MTEEERKAIRRLMHVTNKNNLISKLSVLETYTDKNKKETLEGDIDIVLNLIKKLQKENKEFTKSNKTLSKIVDSMAKHIHISGDYACLYEECDDDMGRECEDCIKEYFYKKVKETKDNGSARKV